jgi:hypothetical protein
MDSLVGRLRRPSGVLAKLGSVKELCYKSRVKMGPNLNDLVASKPANPASSKTFAFLARFNAFE